MKATGSRGMSAREGNAVSLALDAMVSINAARVGMERINDLFMEVSPSVMWTSIP